jgi:4a-hydroxytetrahydrobiopterin dehydratase
MRMAAGSVWRQEGEALVRDFEFDDFRGAMAFVNRVADTAEEVNHHPDILVHGWNKVRLTLSTHSEGGVTDNDHALAQRIDGLAAG